MRFILSKRCYCYLISASDKLQTLITRFDYPAGRVQYRDTVDSGMGCGGGGGGEAGKDDLFCPTHPIFFLCYRCSNLFLSLALHCCKKSKMER